VIHNGIDVEKYKSIADAIELRQHPSPIRVGAIIRVVPIKDLKTMLQAFAIVCNKRKDIEFLIMGPTDEDEAYYRECCQYKEMLQLDRVTFTGSVDIRTYLKDLDLLVLTSISEGQPLAILEGLAATLPFVTTNVGDCDALIGGVYDDFGPAGRVVPIMDYVSIADAILELSQQDILRRTMGQTGYRRVAANYSFTEFIEGYRMIYERLGVRENEWQALASN
jgi:glycosyltransferase involved in cell wall biosynthesis